MKRGMLTKTFHKLLYESVPAELELASDAVLSKAVRQSALETARNATFQETRIDRREIARRSTAGSLRQKVVVPRDELRGPHVERVRLVPRTTVKQSRERSTARPFRLCSGWGGQRDAHCGSTHESSCEYVAVHAKHPIQCYGTMMVSPGFSSMFWLSFLPSIT